MAYCLIHQESAPFKAFLDVTATPGTFITATHESGREFVGTAGTNGKVTIPIKKKGRYSVTSNASGTQTITVDALKARQTYIVNVTGKFTVTINTQNASGTNFASISVKRISSPYGPEGTSTNAALSSGATVYYGDVLSATATANTGFESPTVATTGSITTSGSNYVVGGDCTLTGRASVKKFTLTITNAKDPAGNTASTITVSRTKSPYAGASTKSSWTATTDNAIYHGDVLSISVSTSDPYNAPSVTVNSKSQTSWTVSDAAVTVAATTTVKSLTLKATAGANSTIKLERTGSTYQKAKSETVLTKTGASGSTTVYYGDTIKVTFSTSTGYNLGTHTVGGTARSSGYSWGITADISVISTATQVPYYPSFMTDLWTGYFYDYNSSSGKNYFGHRCANTGNDTGSYNIGKYAKISGNTLTVYATSDDDGGSGFMGEAVKIATQKTTLNNGQKVTVTATINSAGTASNNNFATSNIRALAYSSKPTAGYNLSLYSNSKNIGHARVVAGTTSYSFTFTGTSGSYYIGIGLDANATNYNQDYGQMLSGQITLTNVEIS